MKNRKGKKTSKVQVIRSRLPMAVRLILPGDVFTAPGTIVEQSKQTKRVRVVWGKVHSFWFDPDAIQTVE